MAKEHYLGNIKGVKGDKGDQGIQGIKGDKGDQGIQGIKGDTGTTGATGAQGAKGDKGDPFKYTDFTTAQLDALKGAKGDKGDQGIQGIKGDTGATGATGAQGAKGDKGDPFKYADFTTAQLDALKGAKGDKGDQGIQGIKGDQGIQGIKGDTGATGATGAQGPKGDTGAQGIQGIKGDQGIQGVKGDKGDKGDTGAQGAKGDKGDTGARGPIGGGCGTSLTVAPYNAAAKSKEVADIVLLGNNTDITKINEAITSLNNGGELRFLEGTIQCYSSINLQNNITISGQGGSTIFKKQAACNTFVADQKTQVSIKNIMIDGSSYDMYNLYFIKATKVSIMGVSINNSMLGVGIEESESIIIVCSEINTSSYSITIKDSLNLKIDNCYIKANSGYSIYGNNSSNYSRNCIISNSTIIGSTSVPYIRYFSDSRFSNCYFETGALSVGTFANNSRCIFSNNIFRSQNNKMAVASGDHNLFIGNICLGGITIAETTSAVVNTIIE